MKWYLVVFEQCWWFKTSYGGIGEFNVTGENESKYSRLRSVTVQAASRVAAYNKARRTFKNDENIVHIEEF